MKIIMITAALLLCSFFMLAQQVPVNKVTFESFTRGFRKKIEITPDSLYFQQSGRVQEGSSAVERKALQPGEWEQLMQALEGIKPAELPQMKSAGKERARDAALHSILTIITDEGEFNTPTFDNYKAPAALLPLMNKIRNMEERVSKKE